ncbi:unnamed protein product, partial [Vitis vinifera]|uniref:Uncharacterized protein n=1 Tax=Vitis vinifera TaxID=29760 RepID=D7TZY2_VITVI
MMKVSIFFWPKFRVLVSGDTKEGAKCRWEKFHQISIKIVIYNKLKYYILFID